jgi:NAD(P) transhydrogenase subunit alpha
MVLVGLVLLGIGSVAPPAFLEHFTVFVLACFVGYQVIWNVSASLHTPLMSVTNAISGIIVIGALLQVSTPDNLVITVLSGVAILIAAINIAGGFLVTRRMLEMFRK